MISFKALVAAVLLSATAATPAFAQAPVGAGALYIKNLHDSGYNPKNDFNPNGTIRAAIQEPGLFACYYPNLDVLNGGAPTPAARLSPDWPALQGACASAGGGVSYCGSRKMFDPVMVCSECGEPLSAKEVQVHPGPGARSAAEKAALAKKVKPKTRKQAA
jgi:hypothetical protein